MEECQARGNMTFRKCFPSLTAVLQPWVLQQIIAYRKYVPTNRSEVAKVAWEEVKECCLYIAEGNVDIGFGQCPIRIPQIVRQ